MKSLHKILLKLFFALFLSTNYLIGAANMCYEKPVTSGLMCFGLFDIGCTTTTTIKNISNSNIKDTTILHAFSGFEFDLANKIGIDGQEKTTKKDADAAEVESTLNSYINFNSLIDFNMFGKGIVYRTDDYAKGTTHSIYYKNTISMGFSAEAYYASYKIGNTEYTEKLSLCADYTKDNPRDFEIIFKDNINGNMKIIGNSILCKKNGSSCSEPDNDKNNNELDTLFYKLGSDSSDSSIVNSTSYTFALPSGVNKENILWAALYWQAGIKGTASSTDMEDVQTIKLKAPGDTSYREVSAETYNNRFNWIKNTTSNSAMYYQGVKEVTSILRSAGAGTYQVANINNIVSPEGEAYGDNYTPGHFGGWSMVIVYEDPSDTLKNITIYDGFGAVSGSKAVEKTLSGFLTPSKGAVNSSFMIFASEGDINYKKDKISLTDKSNTKYYLKDDGTASKTSGNYNPMGSSITQTGSDTRAPNYGNVIGIDIKTYDVGALGIILNSQTSTTINLSTDDDVYNPGIFAFSTQLYTPDVCYIEDLSFNGKKIEGSNIPETGDEVEYEVTITNKDNEPAKGVFIEKRFNKPNEITYIDGSMQIAPIPGTAYSAKTDTIGDDTAEYSTGAATAKFLLGTGATQASGGTIDKGAETKFKYKAEVGDQNASENIYLVSYRNSQLDIDFTGIPIRKCQDFNNSFGVYIPVIGKYNTVRSNSGIDLVSGPDPVDPADVKNALYTQIVNKPFDVHVISFANDNITPTSWSGDLNLSIVEVPSSGDCSDANTLLSTTSELHFSTEKYKETTVTPTAASKNALFKMVTSATTVCSRDSFAIRPATFEIVANDPPLIGNRIHSFTFTAAHDGAPTTPALNYTQTIHNTVDKSATTQLIVPVGCALPTPIEYTNVGIPFVDGQVTALVTYPNIGDIEFKLTDSQWSTESSDQTKGDCLVGSKENTPDGDGKVGCNVESTKTFTFIPEKFTSTLTLANANNIGGFTYIADEQIMSAPLTLSATASLDGGGAATNYTAGCFSRDTTTNISLTNNQILSWSDSQTRIKFFDDLNSTSQLLNQAGSQATFLTGEGNFTNGVGVTTFRINFDRNQTNPDNPFNIARNDFNITQIVDTDGVTGSDFNRTNDMNATFVYGRTNASKQRYQRTGVNLGAGGPANIYFESFCFGATCNPALLPNGAASRKISDARWYINDNHVSATDGNVTIVLQKGGANAVADIVDATDNPAGNPSTTQIGYDGSKAYPYKTTMQNGASPWLIYKEGDASATRNEFQVEFDSVSGWSGAHETNTTTTNNLGTSTNRRVIW